MDDHTKPIIANEENSAVKYVLNVLNQSSRSSSWMLNKGTYTVGRLEEHEIILDDVTVSRNHAKIIIESDNTKIIDNNSTNGTYINDLLIKDFTELHSGDQIQIGKFLLLFTKV
jgi:pSer/pThr/pTyr-binding forkhead associated (FHA) protein